MAQIRKALVAGGVAFVGGLGAACSDGKVTLAEAVVALGAGLAALAATYKVSNAA